MNFLKGITPNYISDSEGHFNRLNPKSEYLEYLRQTKSDGANIGIKTKFDKEEIILFIHVALKKTPVPLLDQFMKNTFIELKNRYLQPILPILVTLHENKRLIEFVSDSAEMELQTYHYLTVQIKKWRWDDIYRRKT